MKYLYIFIAFISSTTSLLAADDNILWIDDYKLRTWKVTLDDIPNALRSLIDFFMWIAGTISVIFIIIGAYKILFWSLQQDKTKGRDTIIMALGGFALAALAWMIIKTILANL